MRKLVVVCGTGAFALGLAAAALAVGNGVRGYGAGYGPPTSTATTTAVASGSAKATGSSKFSATLTGAQEVPKPKAPAGAGGTFTARTVKTKSGDTFSWKLTFHGLSGPAVAAHVHSGRSGVAGGVAVSLCGPCRSGMSGRARISPAIETALETGAAYVNVHTAKNPNGEIRGQIARAK